MHSVRGPNLRARVAPSCHKYFCDRAHMTGVMDKSGTL